MSASDAVRYAVIAVCLLNIGVMIALWERVARLFLPRLWMRMLMLANIVQLLVIALGAYQRLGEPITYRSPLWLASAMIESAALIGIHHWYGTQAGREHTERMLRGRER